MNKMLFLLTAMLAFASNAVYAAGDAAAGKEKSAACAACHNADGNSTNPEWPKLAGQHAGYLEKQLRDFKSGARKSEIMVGMVAPLSEQDMADIAAYYASQTRTGGFASEARLPIGEKIYRGGNAETEVPACIACHGPAGIGNPLADIPSLSGQHAQYTATQLNAYRDGVRSNDSKSMMRDVARWMTKDEIDAVAEYIAGLH